VNDPRASSPEEVGEDRLLDLLSRWQEMHGQGTAGSVTALCADCPELAGAAERLRRFGSALEQLARGPANETPLPDRATTGPLPATAAAPALPAPGERYEVERLLGKGGMGAVYRARDRVLDRVVALKVIHGEHLTPALRARFQAEARAVARLDHPHIVKVFDVGEFQPPGEPAPVPFLTLEYVEGGSLAGRLGKGEPLPPAEAARLVAMLARAMQHAHERGIVHRDLKPDNVLLATPADLPALNFSLGCPRIADFGLARLAQSDRKLTQTGAIMGTPAYMAPEQAEGLPDVGSPADVYALGVILYRLLAGRPPFESSSTVDLLHRICTEPPPPLRRLRPDIPEELERICLDCLEKSPDRRPSAPALAGRLGHLVTAGGTAPMAVAQPAAEATTTDLPRRKRFAFRLHGCGVVATLSVTVGILLLALLPLTLQRTQPAGDSRPAPSASTPEVPPWAKVAPPRGREEVPVTAKGPALQIRQFYATHYETAGKEEVPRGRIGVRSFAARVGDGVTLTVDLSREAHFYLIGFNFDGKEQLLWPTDEQGKPSDAVRPPPRPRLRYPEGNVRLWLDDNEKGGLQAYAVAASAGPLPAYAEWRAARRGVSWQALPAGKTVWEADGKGTYAVLEGVGADRGSLRPAPGTPPLAELCKALGGGVTAEAIAFPVLARGAKR
jgi:hypothetical protein